MIRLLLPLAALLAFISSPAAHAATGGGSPVCEAEMRAAAVKYDVPLGVLYAVGLTESGRKDSLQPYAMNIGGKAYFARDLTDALKKFGEARDAGIALIDVGCMQINHHFHGAEFPSVSAMFAPKANVDYAARFLKALRKQEGSWTLAVARYHAGPNNNPAQKRYVCTVITNMVATGFGRWTDDARSFCH